MTTHIVATRYVVALPISRDNHGGPAEADHRLWESPRDRQTDRETDKQTDRQTHRLTDEHDTRTPTNTKIDVSQKSGRPKFRTHSKTNASK